MGVSPLVFNGATIYRPGSYVKRDITAGGKSGGVSLNGMVIIGVSKGGIPYNAAGLSDEDRVMYFTDTKLIKDVLRSGDSVEAGIFAFSGTRDVRANAGANEVAFIRVNPATKSTLALQNSTPAAVINVESADWGVHTLNIQVNISTGTTGKLVQVQKEGTIVTEDDVTLTPMSLQYTGTGTAAGSKTNGTLAINLTSPTNGETSLSIDLSVYDTVQKVVDFINSQLGYTASVEDAAYANMPSNYLDLVTIADAKTNPVNLKADVQAVIESLNRSGYVVATIVSEGVRTNVANLAGYTNLAGGSEGSVTNQSWIDALAIAEKLDVGFVGVMSSDSAVQLLLADHLDRMNSTIGRKERRGFTGCAIADSISTIKTKAATLGSQFMLFYGDASWRYDVAGNLVQMPGYIHAAGCAGISAGNEPTLPLTFKQINIVKAGRSYSQTEINNFIKGGVVIPTPVEGGSGYKIERQVTTYQGSNIIANEWSAIGTVLAITKEHRIKMERRFVGIAGDRFVKQSLESYSEEVLESMLERGWFTEDLETGQKAITNHVITVDGDTFKVSYTGIVTLPVNFVPVTHNFTVLGIAA